MKIGFVTSNPGKIREAQARLEALGVEVVGTRRELEEIQSDSLDEVARHKARQLLGKVKPPFFIEDAGLSIDALEGFPGVYSSYVFRTIGNEGILRLLSSLPSTKRTATFHAVIAYVDPRSRIHLLRGQAHGRIAAKPRGEQGFGFDPIFLPQGSSRTFA
jgi:XTP/dITP diphosphohydrolase